MFPGWNTSSSAIREKKPGGNKGLPAGEIERKRRNDLKKEKSRAAMVDKVVALGTLLLISGPVG